MYYSYVLEQALLAMPKHAIAFSSGPATILDPNHIDTLNEAKKNNGKFTTINLEDNQKLHLMGDFSDFRIYMLATYDRFEILSNSAKILDDEHFSANIRFFSSVNKEYSTHEVIFESPFTPLSELNLGVSSFSEYWSDSFEFKYEDRIENFVCDLAFLTLYGKNLPHQIELNIEYIGIAKASSREAQDRLGDGHKRLQKLLSSLQNKPNKRCAIILYRFKEEELSAKVENFSTTLEIIEASAIKYFRPKINEQRKEFPKDSKSLVKKIHKLGKNEIITLIDKPHNCILRTENIMESNINNMEICTAVKFYFEKIYEKEGVSFTPEHYINIKLPDSYSL